MSENSIYQNIENVLLRINGIKRRFGIKKSTLYPAFQKKLEEEESKVVKAHSNEIQKKSEQETGSVSYEDIIKAASQKYKVPESLIKAVIKQESNFNENAVSEKGALGLMQLMPVTAEILGVENPFDIEENIFGGTRYLRELINRYDGNLNRALAAYNAGPQRVKGGIPNISETVNFIDSVLSNYETFSKYEDNEGF